MAISSFTVDTFTASEAPDKTQVRSLAWVYCDHTLKTLSRSKDALPLRGRDASKEAPPKEEKEASSLGCDFSVGCRSGRLPP